MVCVLLADFVLVLPFNPHKVRTDTATERSKPTMPNTDWRHLILHGRFLLAGLDVDIGKGA